METVRKVLFFILNIASMLSAQNLEPTITIRDLSDGHTLVGQNTTLECQMTFHLSHISVEWEKAIKMDPTAYKEETFPNENVTSTYLTISKLTIFRAYERYQGWYRCKVTYKEWGRSVYGEHKYLNVHGVNYNRLDFNEGVHFDPLKAEIRVEYLAHPNASIAWFNKNNEPVRESSNFSVYKPSFTKNGIPNYYAKLYLKYISNDSLGVYRVNAYNEFKNKSLNVEVSLKQQIVSSLSIDRLDVDRMQAIYKCRAVGLKKPKITLYFVPCKFCLSFDIQDGEKEWMKSSNQELTFDGIHNEYLKLKFKQIAKSSMRKKLKGLYLEDKGLHVTSYVSLNLSETGSLYCVTQDSVETIRFFHPQDGFDILINDYKEDVVKAKSVHYPTYGQFVKVLCAISLYDYVNATEWLHNGRTLVDTNPTYQLSELFVSSEKTVHKLRFQFISENQAGNYTCKVSNKKGEIQSKTVWLKFEKMQSFHSKIVLHDLNAGHTISGGNISLKCEISYYKPSSEVVWGVADSSVENVKNFEDLFSTTANITFTNITTTLFDSTTNTTASKLTIPESHITQGACYVCGVNSFGVLSYSYLLIPVYGTNATVTVFHKDISMFDKHDMAIRIFVTVHPRPIIHWFDNNGTEIQNGSKFYITTNHESIRSNNENFNCKSVLTFKSLQYEDFGSYTIVLDNDNKQESFAVDVNATGVPSVKLDVDKLDEKTMTSTLKCTSVAYPEPQIKWLLKKCTTLNSCLNSEKDTKHQFIPKEELRHLKKGLMITSYISVNISEKGLLRCQSANSFGENHVDQPILYIENKLDFFVENETKRPLSNVFEVVGYKKVRVVCIVSSFIYKEDILWGYNGQYLSFLFDGHLGVQSYNFVFSTVSVFTSYSKVGHREYYTSNYLTKDGSLKSGTLIIDTHSEAFVSIRRTNMFNSSVEVKLTDNWRFYCYVKGFPKPDIKWYKDNHIIESSDRIKITNVSQELYFTYTFPEDEGIYSCEVSNDYATSSKINKLIISNKYMWLYVQLSLLLSAFAMVGILFVYKLKAEKQSARELLYFEQGASGKLNPKLSIESQANLLPYYKRWEVPLKNIKIGEQLGSGAFGVVFQAEVVNFFAEENSKTVAVKTTDPHSGFEDVRALASEMKIMAHLGKHVNIVNFLGACTKNIAKRELYILVEYCRFGNLRDYMLCHGRRFIDQKNVERDDFDYSEEIKESGEDSISICSRDLLVWAFQIARGMEYLSSRRIIHGDLAARNVLLADNNILKISDFGLSKRLYEIGNYTKKQKGLVPVKWLAIECLENGIFSIESDVWSFGVVLWEIFSLGRSPYPGVVFDETFCDRIAEGYRMAIPKAATTTIYNMMLDCWNLDPQLRPSFTGLVARIGPLLNESLRNHYIDMDGGYVSMNSQESAEDVLMRVNPPTFANVLSTDRATSTTTYVNTCYESE